jgi:hypothetical protein
LDNKSNNPTFCQWFYLNPLHNREGDLVLERVHVAVGVLFGSVFGGDRLLVAVTEDLDLRPFDGAGVAKCNILIIVKKVVLSHITAVKI